MASFLINSMRKKIYGYHLRDARLIKDIIKKEIVDVIITSPPYAELKDYGMEGQIGFGQDYYKQYLPDLENIFRQCFEVSKQTGSLWLIMDTYRNKGNVQLLPFDIAGKLSKVGWKLKDIIIWEKDKALPWTGTGQLRNIFEYILFFVKSDQFKYYIDRIKTTDFKEWWLKYPERYNPHGKVPTNIWKISIPIQGSWSKSNLRHFNPFAKELVEKIILLTTNEGDVVLDPFAGSGTVLAQAVCMKRKCIGFDINEKFKKMYEDYVIDETKERWKFRKRELLKIRQKKKDIEKIIIQLRQLKYPKLLIKELKKNSLSHEVLSSILTIFAFSMHFDPEEIKERHLFIKEQLFIVMENDKDLDILKEKIGKVSTKPPLSKFGIHSKIDVCQFKEFIERTKKDPIFTDSELWLYSDGITHKYKQRITIPDWIQRINGIEDNSEKSLPPIISNIRINIEKSKTLIG